MGLLVLKSGILDTIQDTGRYGFAKWGINPGGAMDRYAAQVANAIVGNDLHEGVIEIHFPALQILFQKDVLISIAGADFSPYVNDTEVSLWKPIIVKKNSVLSFQKRKKGNRCYVAVHGGFNLSTWLGSVSTNVKTNTGGLNGLALRKDDIIPLRFRYLSKISEDLLQKTAGENPFFLPWSINAHAVYENPNEIFFIEGNEWNWLTPESKDIILSKAFAIDPSSDRMGCYLRTQSLSYNHKHELLSSAVTFGTIQGLPNGSLVVLMADHQTTGGYPRIGHVITAHLPKLAQLGANENVRLIKISLDAAEKMLFSLQQDLQMIQLACRNKFNIQNS